jgi:hypothetical protein
LGANRTSVTLAARALQRAGLITYKPGHRAHRRSPTPERGGLRMLWQRSSSSGAAAHAGCRVASVVLTTDKAPGANKSCRQRLSRSVPGPRRTARLEARFQEGVDPCEPSRTSSRRPARPARSRG